MTPKLQHFDDEHAEEIRQEILLLIRPFRWRFWGVVLALVIGLPGVYQYSNHERDQAICHSERSWGTKLIVTATPLRPRHIAGVPERHYTRAQVAELRDARRVLLATLPLCR